MKFNRSIFFASLLSWLLTTIFCSSWADNSGTNLQISGYVYVDRNKNGQKDESEAGLAGVAVSNQLDVTLTDEQGKYSIPVLENMVLFISKPAGFELPRDRNNLPQFYYIHHPKGSPSGLKFPGIKPTGNLPAQINFAVYPSEYSDEFRALIVGDPQPRDSIEVGYFRDDIITEMIGKDALFYLALGDIAFDDLNIYDQYNRAVAQIGIPAFTVPGNHDQNYQVLTDDFALETFRSTFGPEYFSFNYGQVHFIVLDDIEYLGWDAAKAKSKGYRGYLSEKQLQWLENDLRFVPENHLIVLTMHIPLYTNFSTESSLNVVNRAGLFKILQRRKNLLALSAHLHLIEHLYLKAEQGWTANQDFFSMNLGAGCGAWWSGPKDTRGIPVSYCLDGSPNGYYLFTFQGNQFNYEFQAINDWGNQQLRIISPDGLITKNSGEGTEIMVNVFNADPQTTVYCQLDNQSRLLMKRTSRKDPFILKYLEKNKGLFPSWVGEAIETDHIWVADLPENLGVGTHTIKISASNSKGTLYSGVKIFEIE